MRARSTNVLSALACRVQFHSDKPVKWRPFLPPETFPPGTVRCSNRRMICEFAMDRSICPFSVVADTGKRYAVTVDQSGVGRFSSSRVFRQMTGTARHNGFGRTISPSGRLIGPISARYADGLSLRIWARILVSRLESRSRQRRGGPSDRDRRNISMAC